MKRCNLGTTLSILVLSMLLILFLSYLYAQHIKDEEVQHAFSLFRESVEREKALMQPEQILLVDTKTGLPQDSVVIETEKGKMMYERDERMDSLAWVDKKEWVFQLLIAFKDPDRAFVLDSLFQTQLKDKGIIARTAVAFSQGDSLVSCSDQSVCQTGIALKPVTFGIDHDPLQIKLQAYMSFSRLYLFSRMPLVWGLILLWGIGVALCCRWQRRKKAEYKDAVRPVEPEPAVPSSPGESEMIEIAPDLFFNKKTGVLKDRVHEVRLTKNRLLAFICFVEAPGYAISYFSFSKNVLGRPLHEDESTDADREWNQAVRKSMTQTIRRLREDLKDFSEVLIENEPKIGYRLQISAAQLLHPF